MGRRRTCVLIGCIMLIFSLSACGGKTGTDSAGGSAGDGDGGGGVSTPVAIAGPKEGQGTISGTCGFPAVSVLAINTYFNGTPERATVAADGAFNLYAYPYPTVVLFLGSDDQLAGHLVFWNGMTSFPLQNMVGGATSDLGGLTISGQAVTPGKDPFSDGDLNLNQAEQRIVKTLSSAYSSVAVRPDADDNGKIDALEGKLYLPYMGYYVRGSFPDGSLAGEVSVPATFDHFDLCFQDRSPVSTKPAADVNFSGPGFAEADTPARTLDPATGTYCSPNIASAPGGLYTATYNGGLLSFLLPDQSAAPLDMIILVPTIKLDRDGNIESLTWTYRLGDGSNEGSIDPAHVITGLHIYMTDTTGNDRAYDSETTLPADSTTHVLGRKVKWSDISAMEIDLYTPYRGCVIFYFAKAAA